MDEILEIALGWDWGLIGNWISITLSFFGAWFGWYSFVLKGSKVKLKAKLVIQIHGAVLDADLKNKKDCPFDFLDGTETPVLYVRARNSGRSPIDVESVELVSTNGATKPFAMGFDKGHELPHRLESGSSGNWMFNIQSATAVSEHKAQKSNNDLKAVIKLANDKTIKSRKISAKGLNDYIIAWNEFHK